MPLRAARRQHHYIGSPRSPGHSKPNSFEDQYDALDKRNQTALSAEDGEVFLTPKSGLEEPSPSTTAAQDKSVRFNQDARARPGNGQCIGAHRAPRTRSPPQRPPP